MAMVVCKASGAAKEVLKYLQRFPPHLGNVSCDRDPYSCEDSEQYSGCHYLLTDEINLHQKLVCFE